jgi:type IV protein arginine methyltransferase
MDINLNVHQQEQSGSVDSNSALDALTVLGEHLIKSIMAGEPLEAISKIVEADAPLWYQDDEGMSPLHAAAYQRNSQLAEYLIQKGAVWNAGRYFCIYVRGAPENMSTLF